MTSEALPPQQSTQNQNVGFPYTSGIFLMYHCLDLNNWYYGFLSRLTLINREPVKYYLVDFFPLRGYPPPLAENHFAKKPLAERGGPPPP